MSVDDEGRAPSPPEAIVPEAIVPDAIFVDTNIPMYAVGRNPNLRHTAEEALQRALDRGIPLVTSAEVFQEILHYYLSRRREATCRAAYRFLRAVCDEILPVEERHTARAFELLLEYTTLDARDALHAAVMEQAGIGTILSKDRHFDLLPTIRRLDPAELAAAG